MNFKKEVALESWEDSLGLCPARTDMTHSLTALRGHSILQGSAIYAPTPNPTSLRQRG